MRLLSKSAGKRDARELAGRAQVKDMGDHKVAELQKDGRDEIQ